MKFNRRRTKTGRNAKAARCRRKRFFRFFCLLAAFFLLRSCINQQREPVHDNLDAPRQIAYNRTPLERTKEDICYIVIHDTANKGLGADAESHFEFFNRENQSSSADFFVDNKEILQVNDYYQYYTWHCGDGYGRNEVTNQNSIGVEICINRDGNAGKAMKNAALLVKRLMKELSIDKEHVVRHYDASGKICPGSMEKKDWKKWKQFLEMLD